MRPDANPKDSLFPEKHTPVPKCLIPNFFSFNKQPQQDELGETHSRDVIFQIILLWTLLMRKKQLIMHELNTANRRKDVNFSLTSFTDF